MLNVNCSSRLLLVPVLFWCVSAYGWSEGAAPPRAARMTYTEGYVHVDTRDRNPGDPAQLNMPLIEGQTVVTGGDGQAEVEFEDGSLVRLTPNSSLMLARLTADGPGNFDTRLRLTSGLVYFELRSAAKFTYTVDAAGDLFSPIENSTVRVNLDEAPAAIAVMDGMVRIERQGSYKLDVHASETFRSDISNAGRYFLTQEVAADSWDQWNESRDQAAADASAQQTAVRDGYAGNAGYGWSDLDANGTWYDVPGRGQVWQPEGGDAAGFDPYENGSWVWYPNAGYLWASSYSWGWTPFRCGGWSYWNSFGWGWTPNLGCGGFGFAGYGGFGYGYGFGYGSVINIVQPPRGYPGHRLPPGTVGVHPILRVGAATQIASGATRPVAQPVSGLRRIGGATATPLQPVVHAYTSRGGSALGASLNRDFAIDRVSHQAVLGVAPSGAPVSAATGSPTYVNYGAMRNGSHPVGRPLGQPAQTYGAVPPQNSRTYQTVPAQSPATQHTYQPMPQRTTQTVQHSAPPPSASHGGFSAPAPAASHSAPSAPSGGGGGKK